jgi:hypothetical protein
MQYFTCAYCHTIQPVTLPIYNSDSRPIKDYLDEDNESDDLGSNQE